MLEGRIVVYSHISSRVSSFIYSLIALFPGCSFFRADDSLAVKKSLRFLKQFGLPLQVFASEPADTTSPVTTKGMAFYPFFAFFLDTEVEVYFLFLVADVFEVAVVVLNLLLLLLVVELPFLLLLVELLFQPPMVELLFLLLVVELPFLLLLVELLFLLLLAAVFFSPSSISLINSLERVAPYPSLVHWLKYFSAAL